MANWKLNDGVKIEVRTRLGTTILNNENLFPLQLVRNGETRGRIVLSEDGAFTLEASGLIQRRVACTPDKRCLTWECDYCEKKLAYASELMRR